MKTATTARSRRVILVWTFISISQHHGCLLPRPGAWPKPLSDGFSIYLFADARLLNGNYFQVVAVSSQGPPIFCSAGRFAFSRSAVTAEVKSDGKFDVRFLVVIRGKKGHRPEERVFPIRPALHVVCRVFGNEFLGNVAVVEVAHGKRIITHLLGYIRRFAVAQIILNELSDLLRRQVLSRRRRLGRGRGA